jgi:hypothetical protein
MAAEYDIEIDQYAYFSQQFTWKDTSYQPIDLTDWEARLQIRESIDDEPVVDLDSTTAGITLGGVDGTIVVVIPSAETAAMPSGELLYDLLMEDPSGRKKRLLEGKAIVKQAVTRPE